ncbi:MAG: four helix bundle protein [Chitinophagaceae bacterium]|nr:four helix bundle protein [Chitinophagaceae bacterium]
MATIVRFEEILSWKEARELNKKIGKLIDDGRLKNSYKLISQIERSAGSIMDNIAEGFERDGNREFLQFLYIAKGSCGELRSQLYRCLDRNYINNEEFNDLFYHAARISSLIKLLINYLSKSEDKGPKYKDRT